MYFHIKTHMFSPLFQLNQSALITVTVVYGVPLRGASTFSEEGGQEREKRRFFFTLPPLLLSLPALSLVFWVGKHASLPTQITKCKTRIT